MWKDWKSRIAQELARAIRDRFGIDHQPVVEVAPRRELGDLASPAPLQLAKTLKKSPRAIAAELALALPALDLVREVRVLGAGFLNFFLDRRAVTAELLSGPLVAASTGAAASAASAAAGKVIIEHTNINPNKAAHIGHLRNAVLGDVLGKALASLGCTVEIQNYIDDTGVQLGDVVVGFVDLRRLSLAEVAALPEPFDYACWDLYSEVGRWYEADKSREALRRETLHALEAGQGPRADMGRLVARRIVRRHLQTMRRIGVGYDLLTRESDILALCFFDRAFARLQEAGAVHREETGKNAGCWVMPLAASEEFAGLEDPDKVIVRSDGTVTYVGKDIAYQLWKLGLLGRDFGYRYWTEEGVWETTADGVADHPPFGGGHRVYNVIDTRQSYLQKIVKAGLTALGYHDQAERSVHFAYEMVALSPATARKLGYLDADEEGRVLEMSGRKGVGVKADDLLDQLVAGAREEVEKRHRDLPAEELAALSREIATAALRFFMAKATNNRVIAFDFAEALSFEGESGPYLQYSLVRVHNIGRKLYQAGLADAVTAGQVLALPVELFSDDLWDLVLEVAQVGDAVEKAVETLELSLIARQALGLAQRFNSLYVKHPILHEADPALRAARLATALVFRRGLTTLTELLGVPIPERM